VFINGELKEEFKNTRLGMKYYEKKNQLEKAIISEDLEKDIYNHLINFFSRYYDKGDFISKRRYGKNEKYVIPYNGEEVLLYWVNKDQYYIKTTEYFRKYTFKVKSDSLTVNFRVVDAQEDKGNIKALERKFFVLNENIFDFDKNKKELNIYFEYRGLTKEEEEKYKYNQSVSQDKINEEIIRILQERIPESSLARLIFEIEGEKTLIEKHLNRYTKRNTTDYFIHKDLKGFLQRELDFYIKNEFLKLEDLQVLEKVLTQGEYFERLRIYFIGISTFRNIALKIIDFLAQIENFQKKLWKKKKFIIDTHYVITLDKIKEYAGERFLEGILDEILGNEKQLKEWEELFGVKVEGREDLIEKNILLFKGWKKLPIDTKYFNEDFKWKLLVALSEKNSLDEILDGVLIKSENFQALNLLLNKYYEKVQTIYIDPPFNKENEADYLYKVGYKDATWITMLENRIKLARELLNERGSIFVRCDYNGNMYVRLLLNEIFGWNNFRNEVIVQTTPGKTKGEGLQLTKAKDSLFIYSYGEKFKFNLYYTTTFESKFLEAIKRIIEKQNIYDQNNKIIELLEEMLWLQLGTRVGERATSSEVSIFGLKLKAPEGRHWEFTQRRLDELINKNKVRLRCRNCSFIIKDFSDLNLHHCNEPNYIIECFYDEKLVNENWTDIAGYTQTWGFQTENAEELLERVIEISSAEGDLVMDFFLGSGATTAVAHKLRRKYIGVEIGEHFENFYVGKKYSQKLKKYIPVKKIGVLGRMKKVLFYDPSGISKEKNIKEKYNEKTAGGFFKYHTLEQYEDALENIEFEKQNGENIEYKKQNELLYELPDYFTKYILEWETKNSNTFLNLHKMKDPFNYKLKIIENYKQKIVNVDLIETFNYLIGLNVNKYKVLEDNERKYVFVFAEKQNKKIIIVWRNLKNIDFEKDKKIIENNIQEFNPDETYINGDAIVKNFTPIEPLFKSLMFEDIKQ